MRAVLWDLDDTLIDSIAARMVALSHAYESCLGAKIDPLALWRSHRGGSLEALGQRLLDKDGPRFVECYREFYYGLDRPVRPYAGIPAVLEACRDNGLELAVVTAKVSWGATEELQRARLLHHFAAVIGADDTDRHKPDPAPIFAAMERLLVDDPEELVFIGDSPADIFAARNAGCRSIAALWGTLDDELLRDASPDFFAATPEEVLECLAKARGGAR
jgi:pyrophosphatase PpaX